MIPNFSFNYNEKPFNGNADCKKEVSDGVVYSVEKGIEVSLKINNYEKYDAVEWVLNFENKTDKNSGIFSDICDCDILLPFDMPQVKRPGYMPKDGDPCVIIMNGMVEGRYYWENDKVSATEYGLSKEFFAKAPGSKKSFENLSGRSSDGIVPIFDVTVSGKGYIAAIGWTGSWKSDFTKTENGVIIKTGIKNTGFYLKPGEKLRTTSILIMKYEDDEDKYNKFRRLIKNHFSHKSCTKSGRDGIMANELWGGLSSDEMVKRLNEYKEWGIEFDDIWLDAGWYGNCTNCQDAFSGDWSQNTGDWTINPNVHPDALNDVVKAAKNIGANLMLWFEPERVICTTKVAKEHPEWFLNIPGFENNSDRILYYGNEEAKKYVCELIAGFVNELDLSCYRQDFNTDISGYFSGNDEENRVGITEIKHITGMYEVWDYLLEKFPHLLIDNCASGGRRIDIETLKRSIPFFRSDYQCNFNENPEVLQTHNANISRYLPYNGCTSKTKNDTYAIRSSYSSSWGAAFYNAIFQEMSEQDFEWAKKITDEYMHIRKYFSMDFYNHASADFDDTSWAIWQYHDADTKSGIVMAFRRCNSPFDSVKIKLKGVLEGESYIVTNLDSNEACEIADEINITLPEKRSCAIFEYRIK